LPTLLHGLIQRAKLQAEQIPYKLYPGGKGVRVWRFSPIGWVIVGELTRDEAEDFLVGKLTQEDR
jgi:hypothetical protein